MKKYTKLGSLNVDSTSWHITEESFEAAKLNVAHSSPCPENKEMIRFRTHLQVLTPLKSQEGHQPSSLCQNENGEKAT